MHWPATLENPTLSCGHATVLKGTDATVLKGTDAAAKTSNLHKLVAAASVLFRTVARLEGFLHIWNISAICIFIVKLSDTSLLGSPSDNCVT